MLELKVGDAVVAEVRDQIRSASKVARVLKFKIVLEDGTEWSTRDGRAYGSRSEAWYAGPHLRLRTSEDNETIRHQNAMAEINKVEWKKLSATTLVAILGLVKSEIK